LATAYWLAQPVNRPNRPRTRPIATFVQQLAGNPAESRYRMRGI
jgi:hypothetical protein